MTELDICHAQILRGQRWFQICLLETNVDDWDESEAIECHKARRPEERIAEELFSENVFCSDHESHTRPANRQRIVDDGQSSDVSRFPATPWCWK